MKHRNEPCTVFQNTLFDDSKNILNRISFRNTCMCFIRKMSGRNIHNQKLIFQELRLYCVSVDQSVLRTWCLEDMQRFY